MSRTSKLFMALAIAAWASLVYSCGRPTDLALPGGTNKRAHGTLVREQYEWIEFVALSEIADENHPRPVMDLDGHCWYAERVPILTARHLDFTKSEVQETEIDSVDNGMPPYFISVEVLPQRRDQLVRWSKVRIGQEAGWIVDGKLIAKLPIVCSIRMVRFFGFADAESASRMLKRLQSQSPVASPTAGASPPK